MKISVITICFNNEQDIRPTIESVINQTYEDIEYIVVDGGSNDKTLEILNEYSNNISSIISEPDKGIYDAINKGFKIASGEVVGMIHAGDKLYDNRVIEDIANHFERFSPDIIYGHSKIVDKKGKAKRINRSPEYKRRLVRYGWMPSHQSIYVKRNLLEKLGYYRTDLMGIADYEWFVRYFYVNNLKIKRLDRFILLFSLGGISTKNYMERLKPKSKNAVKQCWIENEIKPPFGIVYFKLLRKIKQFTLALIDSEI
jgi:glycosyltransferase